MTKKKFKFAPVAMLLLAFIPCVGCERVCTTAKECSEACARTGQVMRDNFNNNCTCHPPMCAVPTAPVSGSVPR